MDLLQHGGQRIFRSRMVPEIKGVTTSLNEKSRLVIQGLSDEDNDAIMTQLPTIQRVSQRLVVAIAVSLVRMSLELRNVTQV
jgi:hypothetical protein